ncbi:DMT family transporter [Microbaculum marinum]|uniref:DMT family transporter n=1 Tax=Microbaculum marinum TaxID=1764581 RepID=A0AAW9RLS5_9HYPH
MAPAAPEVPVVLKQDPGSAGGPGNLALGYTFAVLGALTFSSKAIFIKLAYAEGMGVEPLLALRMMLALPVYLAIGALSLHDRRRRGEGLPAAGLLIKAVVVGALGYWVAMYLDFAGLSLIPAQFNVLILMTYPLFVVIFGALIFRFPVQIRAVIAFAVAYIGIGVIFSGRLGSADGKMILGAAFVLAAAVTFALYMLFAKEVIGRMGARLFTCVTMVAVSILAIGQFLIVDPISALSITREAWIYTILLAVVSTIFPTFLINAALQQITAQANSTIGMLAPVASILLAFLVLGEMLSVRDMIGAALVIGGVGWFTLGGRRSL